MATRRLTYSVLFSQHPFVLKAFTLLLASSISLCTMTPFVIAGPGEINSTNVGRMVRGGTYYNTARGKTTFTSRSGGLWIKRGVEVRGLESDSSGRANGHGGSLHFSAPGQGIRVDGKINVNAALGENGAYIGNGGRVYLDAKYVHQAGQIFANGINGGVIQVNVGSMTMVPGARIEARGFGGNGGNVNINASGVVDIQPGTIIDVSGRVSGIYDMGVINIEGGLINMEGILQANGIVIEDGPSRGGTIRLVASGQSNSECVDCAMSASNSPEDPMFTADEMSAIRGRMERLIQTSDGSVVIGSEGQVLAEGSKAPIQGYGPDIHIFGSDNGGYENSVTAGNGGTIILSAMKNIENAGLLSAKGGSGFEVFQNDWQEPTFNLSMGTEDDGCTPHLSPTRVHGGAGGAIVLTALDSIHNKGLITVDGGAGDLSGQSQSASNWDNGSLIQPTLGFNNSQYATVQDYRDFTSGNGGQGGLLAAGYGNSFINTGHLSAQGGAGGKGVTVHAEDSQTLTIPDTRPSALAFQTFDIEEPSSNAFAQAEAYGGRGGYGGDGGLMVFSGPNNPNGEGTLNVSGGLGGDGGDASARAEAVASIWSDPAYTDSFNLLTVDTPTEGTLAYAKAIAVGGQGGRGGSSGVIVTPNPETLLDDQTVLSQSCSRGAQGDAATSVSAVGDGTAVETITQQSPYYNLASGGQEYTEFLDGHGGRSGHNRYHFDTTRENELLTHDDNLILLSRALPEIESPEEMTLMTTVVGGENSLADLFNRAIVRSVNDPYGEGSALYEVYNRLKYPDWWWGNYYDFSSSNRYRNFIAMGGQEATLNLSNMNYIGNYGYSIYTPYFSTITFLNKGDIINNSSWQTGITTDWKNRPDYGYNYFEHIEEYLTAGGKISILANGSIRNDGGNLYSYGWLTGGSVHLAANNGNLVNEDWGHIQTYSSDNYKAYHWLGYSYGYGWYWVTSWNDQEYIGGQNGGAVTLKASHDIVNGKQFHDYWSDYDNYTDWLGSGYINASTAYGGGTIQLAAGHDIINMGTIYAQAWRYNDQNNGGDARTTMLYESEENTEPDVQRPYYTPAALAGNIYSNAGNTNLNLGRYDAYAGGNFDEEGQGMAAMSESSQYPIGNGYGGFIHLHGDNAVLNVDLSRYDTRIRPDYYDYGFIRATGSKAGGTVWLTAGGTRGTDAGLGEDYLEGSDITSLPGTSIAQYVGPPFGPVFNELPLTQSGIAYNFNVIDTRGYEDDGDVGMGGVGRAGVGLDSVINGLPYTADLNTLATQIEAQRTGSFKMAAGEGAVEVIACSAPGLAYQPPEPSPVTPPPLEPVVRPGQPLAPTPGSPLAFDILGLFQEFRPLSKNQLPRTSNVPLIGYSEPVMFYAEEYLQVSENILENALEKYREALTNGSEDPDALKTAMLYLMEAGMDTKAAQEMLSKIDQGLVSTDAIVVKLLQAIAKEAKPEEEFAL